MYRTAQCTIYLLSFGDGQYAEAVVRCSSNRRPRLKPPRAPHSLATASDLRCCSCPQTTVDFAPLTCRPLGHAILPFGLKLWNLVARWQLRAGWARQKTEQVGASAGGGHLLGYWYAAGQHLSHVCRDDCSLRLPRGFSQRCLPCCSLCKRYSYSAVQSGWRCGLEEFFAYCPRHFPLHSLPVPLLL